MTQTRYHAISSARKLATERYLPPFPLTASAPNGGPLIGGVFSICLYEGVIARTRKRTTPPSLNHRSNQNDLCLGRRSTFLFAPEISDHSRRLRVTVTRDQTELAPPNAAHPKK